MPRAQKHPCVTRYQLEKLRLDVALKRERLSLTQRAARKPIPLSERPLPRDAQIDAVNAQNDAVQRDIRLIRVQDSLAYARKTLARERKALEKISEKAQDTV